MADVIALPVVKKFPVEGELSGRITALIMEYADRISLVSAVGVLEVVKEDLLKRAK